MAMADQHLPAVPPAVGQQPRTSHGGGGANGRVVIAGGNSEAFFHDGAKALVALLPNAHYQSLEGQDHAVSPDALAPVQTEFFGA